MWVANMLRNGEGADRNQEGGDISQPSWSPCCAILGRLERRILACVIETPHREVERDGGPSNQWGVIGLIQEYG